MNSLNSAFKNALTLHSCLTLAYFRQLKWQISKEPKSPHTAQNLFFQYGSASAVLLPNSKRMFKNLTVQLSNDGTC